MNNMNEYADEVFSSSIKLLNILVQIGLKNIRLFFKIDHFIFQGKSEHIK